MLIFLHIRNNTGAPLQLRYVEKLVLRNTTFEQNINNATPTFDTDDTEVEDLYDVIQTSGGLTYIGGVHSVDVTIDNCTFQLNQASRNLPNDSRPVLLKQNGHGGSMLIRLSGTYSGRFLINNTSFISNSAEVDGGAVYISYSDNSTNNTILFNNCTFSGNSVTEAAGGAISINSYNYTFSNTIITRRCNFNNNTANTGGAVSMALYNSNQATTELPDRMLFSGCNFIGNSAINEGTAVGLFSLVHVDQVGFLVNFTNW